MTLPLFERYPKLQSLPRVGLCELPTPLAEVGLEGLSAPLRVKRDDLTSVRYGGNKVRKLEFLLGQALKEGRRAVITFGAYGSNHALATAVHASALGLEPHAVLSPQAPGPFAARTLRAHASLGTVLHPVDGWDGTREAVRARRRLAERDGVEPLVIPMGGTGPAGVVGYVNAALELVDQAGERMPEAVYVAAGTLGTAVGLSLGFAIAGERGTRVVAVRVTPTEIANSALADKITAQTLELLAEHDPDFARLSAADMRLDLRDDWFEPGYGVVTPETADAVSLAAAHGLGLETTYTGKALAALLDDAREGRTAVDASLFWNTYSSAPYPPPGPLLALPAVLREYVTQCERLYGASGGGQSTEGDTE